MRFTWTDEAKAQAVELANNGASHADIAAMAGCSKATVARMLAAQPVGFAPAPNAADNDGDEPPVSVDDPAPAPCAPAAPAGEQAPAPADEQPARAPHAPATAPATPGVDKAPALPVKSRVTVTIAAMRRPEGVTVTELAALFAAEFGGNGKASTAQQAIYKAPKARGLTPRNTGEKREGRAVYKID